MESPVRRANGAVRDCLRPKPNNLTIAGGSQELECRVGFVEYSHRGAQALHRQRRHSGQAKPQRLTAGNNRKSPNVARRSPTEDGLAGIHHIRTGGDCKRPARIHEYGRFSGEARIGIAGDDCVSQLPWEEITPDSDNESAILKFGRNRHQSLTIASVCRVSVSGAF